MAEIPAAKKKVVIKKVAEEPSKKKPAVAKTKTVVKKSTSTKKKVVKKSEFGKHGQTKPTPPESDALRKFYTSLLKQNPNSEMAKKWCLEHGLHPDQQESLYVSLSKMKI
jgi:hypothetical protein